MNGRTTSVCTRRQLLHRAGFTAGVCLSGTGRLWGQAPRSKPKVAAIFTELRFRSHAYNILENFFEPYLFDGRLVDPGCEVVSFYSDQFPENDLAREVSKRFSIPLYKSIDEALCRGGQSLAVDAVLLIGEHGEYPYNKLGQHLYPRKEFFDQAVAVMRRSGKYVPLFNDKHLSYRWDWAREMYDTARQHKMPLMAGTSVTLAERRPSLELPSGAEFTSALVVHGGGMEVYGFHGLELLQSMVESRRGGETGIRRIELLSGEAFKKAADQQRWPRDLADAAMAAERQMAARRQVRPPLLANQGGNNARLDDPANQDHAMLVTYRDGLQATVLKIGNDSNRWNFACQLKGESQPRATAMFNGPWGNRCLFKALSHAIQHLFVEQQEPYPAERTLLTTGAIEAAMQSFNSGQPHETPHLSITYQAADWRRFRESGASWKQITVDTPQPVGFVPGDKALLR